MLHLPVPTRNARPVSLRLEPDEAARAGLPEGGSLRRPRTLARAARAGAALYRRERDLKTLLPAMTSPRRRAQDVADRLLLLEAECEVQRRAQTPDYSVRRHVLVLSALAAETAAAKRPNLRAVR